MKKIKRLLDDIATYFLESIGKAVLPSRLRIRLHRDSVKAGLIGIPHKAIGLLFHLSWISTLAIYIAFIYPFITEQRSYIVAFATLAVWVFVHSVMIVFLLSCLLVYLDLKIFKRTKDMEAILPDFLRYVSEDLRAGMPFDKALWGAIRPEFGILSNEISLVAKRSMTGEDVDQALEDFAEKYDSPMLKRTFNLMIEAVRGGGKIADTIDKIEEQLRETNELKREMVATNTSYMFFIGLIVIGIAPMLFGLSYSLLLVLKSVAGKLQFTTAHSSALPIDFSTLTLEPSQFVTFSMLALAVIAIFSSMIISIIKNANIKGGVKYIPFFTAASLGMYWLLKGAFAVMFGGMV